MRTIFAFAVSMSLIAATSLAASSAPSPLKEVQLASKVGRDQATGLFTYEYSVFNPAANNGDISSISVAISSSSQGLPLNSKNLIIEWGKRSDGTQLTRTFDQELATLAQRLEKQVLPVGLKGPNYWLTGISVMGTARWGSLKENKFVAPGKSLTGFVITSYGLPEIRDASIEPYLDVDNLPGDYAENVELTRELESSLTYHTKTIGPSAPPAQFVPSEFLDYIMKIEHEAYELGWIIQGRKEEREKRGLKESGIIRSLDEKLEKAKAELRKNKYKNVIEKLRDYLNEVEALHKDERNTRKGAKENSHAHITSEAYALLKYNSEYFMRQLSLDIKEKSKKEN